MSVPAGSRPEVAGRTSLESTVTAIGMQRREEAALLYFAYTARIAPDVLAKVAPGAEFEFIAHLPEWRLEFPINGNGWDGALPSVTPTSGSTVWGAVFSVPDPEVAALDEIESEEDRVASEVEAMDRTGRRHQVRTHVYDGPPNGNLSPSSDYLTMMLAGSRHWSLPAGWIAGLEEYLEASS
jgi:gamma-glutamylcyclotransferase (GGCT)/AIG2-like uncharacterized protein YtfP